MELISLLMGTGLTRYEAQAYAALLACESATGYEAAKCTGISRSNIYLALEGLVEKGAACRIEGEAVRYAAVPAAEYCENKKRAYLSLLSEIRSAAPVRETAPEAYITVTGDGHIVDKMRNLIAHARERVYVSQSAAVCRLIEPELADAVRRGLRVVVVTTQPFALAGAELCYTEKDDAQIRLIADSSSVLTG